VSDHRTAQHLLHSPSIPTREQKVSPVKKLINLTHLVVLGALWMRTTLVDGGEEADVGGRQEACP
jgi:hypothetical protein